MRSRAKVGTRLVAFLGLLASVSLVVVHSHRPGDFRTAIVAIGIAAAALSAMLGIMQTHSSGRIHVPGTDNAWPERFVNSKEAVIWSTIAGIAVAVFGL